MGEKAAKITEKSRPLTKTQHADLDDEYYIERAIERRHGTEPHPVEEKNEAWDDWERGR